MRSTTRRTFIKIGCAAVSMALCGGMLAGCSGGASDEGAQADTSQVVVALSTEAEPSEGFNPIINWGCGEHMHEPLIQSTLVTTDADLNFHNDLATDYWMSDDGLTWTFTIRDDVTFTDGVPLTAEDVAFTINTIISTGASEADLSMIEKAEATDPTTVVITLNKPYNALLYLLAVVGIVPEHAYSDDYGTNPIGSGRYMLEQWDQGQQAILVANPDYYGEAPKIERVVILFMGEDASLAAASSGDVDVAYTSATLSGSTPEGYSILACKSVDSRGLALPVVPSGSTVEIGGTTYNVGNDITANIEVRKAINTGVDRQRFIDNVLNGYGTVAYSVGTDMPWYSEDMEVAYDPEAAMKYMTDAGWELGDDGIFVRDGQRCSIDIYYMSTDSVRQAIALEFANQMKEIGIEINPTGLPWDEMQQYMYSNPCVWGFGSNAPFEITSLYCTDGGFNVADYSNLTVDAYIDQALAAPSIEESFQYWKLAQWDGTTGIAPQGDAPWVWIANVDHLFFVRDGLNVADQKPQPHGHGWSVLNNVDQWSWEVTEG